VLERATQAPAEKSRRTVAIELSKLDPRERLQTTRTRANVNADAAMRLAVTAASKTLCLARECEQRAASGTADRYAETAD